MLLSGAWGKVIHEKNLKQKISWHCPFKSRYGQCCGTVTIFYGSGCGSNFWKVTGPGPVPVPVPAPYLKANFSLKNCIFFT